MAKIFDLNIFRLNNCGKLIPKYDKPVRGEVSYDAQGLCVKIIPAVTEGKSNYTTILDFTICSSTECCRILPKSYLFTLETESLVVEFTNEHDCRIFHMSITKAKSSKNESVFSVRTDDSSAMQYFQFYGYLSQQQNMLQDFIRTHTYQRAILGNIDDFRDKVVLDVGAGSGILSFFAVQAGARKVYAVEASNMAHYAHNLVEANNLSDKIKVIAGKIEEIELPEKVNVIISEPMGYMLFNERMLETYLHAKKWLLSNGKMYPSRGDLHIAPFTDDALYMEQYNKANFWYQTCFHGVDLSSMRVAAMKEYFRQPIVDTFDIRICLSKSIRHIVDFTEAHEHDLHTIDIPLEFHILENGTCHGLAFWFDVAFNGCSQVIWLSTGPTEPLTHWYQVRCLLEEPLFVKQGQMLNGRVLLVANKRQSYDVTIELQVEGTGTKSYNMLDLKNPYFRYTGAPVAPPPQVNITSPSENYWNQIDAQGARNAVNMVNGMSVNGLGEISMDTTQAVIASNLIALVDPPHLSEGTQPNIHPGCISSTGTGSGTNASSGRGRNACNTQQQQQGNQLIGTGIPPSLFHNSSPSNHTQQLVMGNYPINANLMIGDYMTPASSISVQGYRQ